MRAIKIIIVLVSAAFYFVGGTVCAESVFDCDFNREYIDIVKLRAGRPDALAGFELHGLKKDIISDDSPKTLAEETVSITEQPNSEKSDNRSLCFTLNNNTYTNTIKLVKRFNPTGKKSVYEFNIMYSNMSNNHFVALQWVDESGKWFEPILFSVYKDSESRMKLYENKGQKSALFFKPGEWVNIRVIMDCTATKNGTPDYAKWKMKLCANNKLISEYSFADRSMTSLKEFIGIMYCFYGTDVGAKYGERNVYIDDVKYYTVDEEELPSCRISDYGGSVIMKGMPLYFQTQCYVGSDERQPVRTQYYDNGTLIGSESLPFGINYTPAYPGMHKITAKVFSDFGEECQSSTYVMVDDAFDGETITAANFEEYANGMTNMKNSSGEWHISDKNCEANIDAEHGKSLLINSENGYVFSLCELNNDIYKFSGEYYFEINDEKKRTLNFSKAAVETDFAVGYAQINISNTKEVLYTNRWYRIDIIADLKAENKYCLLYVDGKCIMRYPCDDIHIKNGVNFLYLNDSGLKTTVDNLSVSNVRFDDAEGFSCGGKSITSISEMTDSILNVRTKNNYLGRQIIAVYDKDHVLKHVTINDANTIGEYVVGAIELENFEDIYVKSFLWDGLSPLQKVKIIK